MVGIAFVLLVFEADMAEAIDLLLRQLPEFADLQTPEGQVSDADAIEGDDLMIQCLHHAADFPLLAFVDGDGEDAFVFAFLEKLSLGRGGFVTFPGDIEAFGKLFDLVALGFSADLDDVFLLWGGGRMHDEVGELAIIGQDEKAGGIEVQPTDGEEAAVLLRDELQNGFSSLRIIERADIASGFVEKEIMVFLVFADDLLAVHADVVRLKAGKTEGNRLPIDLDTALADEFLGLSSGAVAQGREDFLDSFFFHGSRIGMFLF